MEMTQKVIFEKVIECIEENIEKTSDEIKKEIQKVIDCSLDDFGRYFNLLTRTTITKYIKSRKLYYAYLELITPNEKKIPDIAIEYGYNDQSAFTNAFKKEFNINPGQITNGTTGIVKNNKLIYEKLTANSDMTHNELKIKKYMKDPIRYLESAVNFDVMGFVEAKKEFDFDDETAYLIGELADKFNLPYYYMFDKCFDILIDANNSNSFNFSSTINEDLTDEEIKKILEYYPNLEPEEIDPWLIDAYKNKLNIRTYVSIINLGYYRNEITPELLQKYYKGELKKKGDK